MKILAYDPFWDEAFAQAHHIMQNLREKLAPMIVSTDQHACSHEDKEDGEETLEPGNREAVGQTHSQGRREDTGADL